MVSLTGLEFKTIHQPPNPACWDQRCVQPHLANAPNPQKIFIRSQGDNLVDKVGVPSMNLNLNSDS